MTHQHQRLARPLPLPRRPSRDVLVDPALVTEEAEGVERVEGAESGEGGEGWGDFGKLPDDLMRAGVLGIGPMINSNKYLA